MGLHAKAPLTGPPSNQPSCPGRRAQHRGAFGGGGAPSPSRRSASRAATHLGGIFALLLLVLAVAQAGSPSSAYTAPSVPQLVTIGAIGSVGSGTGQYEFANGLAVNETTGNIYVLDLNLDRVDVFDKEGNFLFEFGEPGSGAGQLNSNGGLSIDQSNGDVYVGETVGPTLNARISKFTESGEFILTFGKQVDQTTGGDVCTAASGDVCQGGVVGDGEGEFAGGLPVVSQISHNVLVPSPNTHRIQVFSPSGQHLSTFPAPEVTDQIAIDSHGNIYGLTSGVVNEYSEVGSLIGQFAPSVINGSSSGFTPHNIISGPGTAKPAETHIFVGMANNTNGKLEIGEFGEDGALLAQHGIGLPGMTSNDIASSSVNGHLYAATWPPDGRVLDLSHPVTLPIATIEPASGITASGATMNAAVNPNGSIFNTGYHFEYRNDNTTNWSLSPGSDVNLGNGTSAIPVSRALANLDPNTLYHFRAVATREAGAGSVTSGESTFTTNPIPPVTSLIQASFVTDTSARIGASINAEHSPTTYYFKYGTTTAYGQQAPVGEEGDAGQALGNNAAFQTIGGLTPNTTYHFCVVATNVAGSTTCEDHTFTTTTQAAQEWPSRGLELVNEPDKGNQSIFPAPPTFSGNYMSGNGERVGWQTTAGTPDSSAGAWAYFVSTRTPTGWTTKPFAPTAEQQPAGTGNLDYEFLAANPGLNDFVFGATEGFFAGGINNYLIKAATPEEQELLEHRNDKSDSYYQSTQVTQASQDLSHVVVQLAGGASGSFIDYHGGQATVLNTPACGGTFFFLESNQSAVGDNGVYISSAGDSECGGPKDLYFIDFATNTATLVSGPPVSGPDEGAGAVGMTKDGSAVLFITKSALLPTDGNNGPDIYRWTQASEHLECVTCTIPPFSSASSTVVATSADLSHVYFDSYLVADGAEPVQNCNHVGDPCNLYVLRTESHELHYIGQDGRALEGNVEVRFVTTPDGNVLAFESELPKMTPDLLAPIGKEREEGEEQVFRYDDRTEQVECVSCLRNGGVTAHVVNAGDPSGHLIMSADGQTIAFNTHARLTPADINGVPDIYEWHNGVVRLVTDGVHVWPENGLGGRPQPWGLSEDGKNLLLSVGGFNLTGYEHDFYANVYDARVGGGFTPPSPAAHCSEDACQGPLQPPPPLDFQGSSAFSGPGSPAPVRKRHGRHHHKKRRHRRAAANHRRG